MRLAPDAMLEDLLDIIDLSISGGVSYIGGAEHVLLDNFVGKQINLPAFPQCIWHPKTVGFGTSELLSIESKGDVDLHNNHQFEKIKGEVSKGKITILYYLVNSGIQLFKDSWMRFLTSHNINDEHVDTELGPIRNAEAIMEKLTQKYS